MARPQRESQRPNRPNPHIGGEGLFSLGEFANTPWGGPDKDRARPLSEPPPDAAFSSRPVSLFLLLVRVAQKLRSLRPHPPRFCRLAVFLIPTNVSLRLPEIRWFVVTTGW